MFESSSLQTALEKGRYRREKLALSGGLPAFLLEDRGEKKILRLAVTLAVVLHVILFVVTFPKIEAETPTFRQENRAFVVKQVRFEPPPPKAEVQVPKKREKRKIIPIPDPTPEEPEPIREIELDLPEVDAVLADDAIFGVPEGIVQGPGRTFGDALQLSGDIVPPQKVFTPQPIYTEEARQARIQGVVILQAIIDATGGVTAIKILKGLPEGLSEAAVEAVKTWRYQPATLDGRPVAVYYNFTISFSLQ